MFEHFNPTRDIPNLTGRTALITGANSGIGFQTALHLSKSGAKVYITCRSEAKALDTIRRLEEANPALVGTGRVGWLVLDLSDVRGTREAAEEFLRKEERLDILINNAAQLASRFNLTSEGLSDIFATNHVGPFVFTTTLLPLMEATSKLPGADVRIITVASSQHLSAPTTTKFETVEDFREKFAPEGKEDKMSACMARYRQSKLANVLFAKELQKRLDAAGLPILSISLHPGNTATEGAEKMVREILPGGAAYALLTLFIMTPQQGAITQLFAATSPDVRREKEKYAGQYLVPYGCVAKPSSLARKEGMSEQLCELTERVVREILENGSV